ncbi:MAG TPA: radical SAM protein, partial [Candidatus Dormibacteraeota bacterium]|nr:radical SAM protein [Candidatus Dormibacteraeota bacterium]
GSPMGDLLPPPTDYVESMYRRVAPYLVARGLTSAAVRAGCARCNACSALGAFERSLRDAPGRRLAVLGQG